MRNNNHVQDVARSLLRKIQPVSVVGLNKIRIGRFNDGGYIMLNDFSEITAAYSFGVSDEISWDFDLARRGVNVYMYDHTIEGISQSHSRLNWTKIGLTDQEIKSSTLNTLPYLISQNGHSDSKDLLLKCDIEGDEWKVFAALEKETLQKFKQIVVELHRMRMIATSDFWETARLALDNLTMLHSAIHVHGNNHSPWCILGGVPIPDVLEVTLVRTADFTLEESSEIFPTSIDQANNHNEPDMYLGKFKF